ncbi:MAG: bifunctional adenosylcobinamide kinase/adenosylcobinamide-phosphate guanylyltransferase [Peptoniphilus sp.]|nr:bifunctional adenosylcobinamide kinase/adenosylcobinamide-phosphate guanylyltransferase [Peptoniphilus sp.]MDY3118589.1 bifunctional adenosylcobinamide kinase/adenosylcobinamide-phosphate guanylyltransferase [Peptoniphilus sp.]
MIVLITGGARSGKSAYAESRARAYEKVLYIATAKKTDDEEMIRRVEKHRARRPASWRTAERDARFADAIKGEEAVLLDCVTIMISNYLWACSEKDGSMDEEKVEALCLQELESLIVHCKAHGMDLFMVTNEVGSGIVPMSPVSRAFRDIQGRVNQRLAQWSDEVYASISGIAVKIK